MRLIFLFQVSLEYLVCSWFYIVLDKISIFKMIFSLNPRESERGVKKDKGRKDENKRKWDGQEGGRTVTETKEKDTLIEEAIKGLLRNITLGKFPGILQNDPC